MNLSMRREHRAATSAIAYQELSVDEIVAKDLVLRKELTQSTRVGLTSGEETDPDGGVDEYHLRDPALAGGLLSPPGHFLSPRLRAPQRAKPRVRGVAKERFQPEADRLRVGGGPTHGAGLPEQGRVDVERLLHMVVLAILVHLRQPYTDRRRAACDRRCRCRAGR